VPFSHLPFSADEDPRISLPPIYQAIQNWLDDGERVLLHREELGDELMGVVAGFLLWTRRLPSSSQAISVAEHLLHRQMGPAGRRLVADHNVWANA